MKTYRATVILLINADSEAEACDAVSALLTKQGLYAECTAEDGSKTTTLRDWSYVRYSDRGAWRYAGPHEVITPADYDRDKDTIEALQPAE